MKNTTLYILLISSLIIISCNKDKTYAEKFEQMKIEISNDLHADNLSTAMVSASFEENLLKEQEITFTTSEGLLYQMPYDPNSTGSKSLSFAPFDDQAEVLLQANTLDPKPEVFVSLTVNDFTKKIIIPFLPARPDDMLLEVIPQQLSVSENTEISVQLFKDQGSTSNDLEFRIRDSIELDTSGIELQTTIPDFVFSSNNEVKIPVEILQYSPGSRLRVFVSTEDADGALLEKSVLIYFE